MMTGVMHANAVCRMAVFCLTQDLRKTALASLLLAGIMLRKSANHFEESNMGLIAFIKEAGEKLFHHEDTKPAMDAAAADPTPENVDAANTAGANAITAYIQSMNLDATGLTVTFDSASGVAKVYGVADTQEIREKIILCSGNVAGVVSVQDEMSTAVAEPENQYYTVVSGDTLSKIAQETMGAANHYNAIFEANKPMLSSPDKIYPGQVLRIPAAT
jgi:nucleoid-associated protein YgaU